MKAAPQSSVSNDSLKGKLLQAGFVEFPSAYQARYDRLMEQINDMPLREAVRLKLALICPVCKIAHPGIRYSGEHKNFCSRLCWERRDQET